MDAGQQRRLAGGSDRLLGDGKVRKRRGCYLFRRSFGPYGRNVQFDDPACLRSLRASQLEARLA